MTRKEVMKLFKLGKQLMTLWLSFTHFKANICTFKKCLAKANMLCLTYVLNIGMHQKVVSHTAYTYTRDHLLDIPPNLHYCTSKSTLSHSFWF